jgi:superfamily II DNA/RNA helicase/cold shock CspA family protein
VRQVVVDEADRMSDMGFLPAVRRIVGQTHEDRQVLLFSATLDGAVGKLADAAQRNPVRHEVGPTGPDMSAARHVFWTAERLDRPALTADVIRTLGSTIVFCRTRHGADRLAKQLGRVGVSAAAIHGDRSQAQRDRALQAFASGEVPALVATDVASRGVHVDDVAAVVHFDPPADGATYIHRSGRTARAGASGVVVSLIEPTAMRDAHKMQRDVGIDSPVRPPAVDELRPPAPNRVEAPAAEATVAAAPLPTITPAAGRQLGTVTTFHDRRGFGFIDAGREGELFVHQSNLTSKVASGQRVEFAVRPGRKGLEAFDVVAV